MIVHQNLNMQNRVSQKNTFVVYNFGGRITGAYGSPEPPKKFQNYRPINDPQTLISIFGRFQSVKTGQNMQKLIFGHKILQEHATTIQLALLSYIFIALSRDTPLANIFFAQGPMAIWPYGHIWPYLAIYGLMAIGPYATNMGKWGIPGKIYKNVAQQC